MGVSKVVYGNNTLVDLTNDTVSAEKLLEGETAHGADGEPIAGTLVTTDAEEIDYEDYQELTPEEQADGSIRFIPDYPSIAGRPGAAAGEVGFDNTDSDLDSDNVQDAIVEVNDKVNNTISGNTVELSNTATQAHAVGEYFIWIGQFVKTTAAIAVGDTIAIGTNVVATNVSSILSELNNNLLEKAIGFKTSATFLADTGYADIDVPSGVTLNSNSIITAMRYDAGLTSNAYFIASGGVISATKIRLQANTTVTYNVTLTVFVIVKP